MKVDPKLLKCVVLLSMLLPLGALAAPANPEPAMAKDEITVGNKLVRVTYHTHTGRLDVAWQDGSELIGLESGVQLADGRSLVSSGYAKHEPTGPRGSSTSGAAGELTIRNSAPGSPALIQHISVMPNQPWISVTAELDGEGSSIGTRHFDAVILKGTESIRVKDGTNLRALHVPFDNDMWFRYDSELVKDLKPDTTFSSNEVTAIYDNESRRAIVVGSITHDMWKTAINMRVEDWRIAAMDVYGGISNPNGVRTDTHDTVPHGLVHGARVQSPRVFIGAFSDWRDGLEAYGAANAAVQPPLKWPSGAPVGWNSWAAYAEKIDYNRYLGAAAFLHEKLQPQGFERNKIVYVNLDAFWSRLDAVQLADAGATIKSMRGADGTRFEPGIYWTPFAYWFDDLDAWVEGTGMKYRYRDILLRAPDGSLLPKVDGGRPIDPSHPGTKARTQYFMKRFQEMGFAYLKLDFLSHGALEGKHFDASIQTGIQAYNEGMKQIVDENAGRMFLSLSIAPLFPSGYGHARRLSCDTKGHIGDGDQSTEYMLNSLTYGWWTHKTLYLADPDHVVLGEKADLGARSVEEGKSRLLSAIIASGMILDSSRLADDEQARLFAQQVYGNRRLLAIGEDNEAFRPIEGNTGNRAAAAFVRRSPHGTYLAVFNYEEKQPQTITVDLSRIDPSLGNAQSISVMDIEAGQKVGPVHGAIRVELQPAQSKLLELQVEAR